MQTKSIRPYMSTGELGELLGIQAWRIARLFELASSLSRFALLAVERSLPPLVPQIVDALRARNWLPSDKPEGD